MKKLILFRNSINSLREYRLVNPETFHTEYLVIVDDNGAGAQTFQNFLLAEKLNGSWHHLSNFTKKVSEAFELKTLQLIASLPPVNNSKEDALNAYPTALRFRAFDEKPDNVYIGVRYRDDMIPASIPSNIIEISKTLTAVI